MTKSDLTKADLLKRLEAFTDDMKIEFMVTSNETCDDAECTWHRIELIEVLPWIPAGSQDFIYNDYDQYIESLLDDNEYATVEDAEKANPEDSFEKRIVIYTGAA